MELKEIEKELKLFEHREWEKAKMRLHNKEIIDGEKPSKYFLAAEKQHKK